MIDFLLLIQLELEIPISEDIKAHKVLNEEISSDSNGPTALKHLLQQVHIVI